MLTEWLWEESQDLIHAALNTGFIQGIKNGTLSPTKYGSYTLDDTVYFVEAAKTCAIATEKSTGDISAFASSRQEFYKQVVRNRMVEWHINNINSIDVLDAVKKFYSWERHVAETMDPIYAVVMTVPCFRLWPWMARQMEANATANNIYSFWIEENKVDMNYKAGEEIVNKYASTIDRDLALRVYRASLQHEIDSFNAVVSN